MSPSGDPIHPDISMLQVNRTITSLGLGRFTIDMVGAAARAKLLKVPAIRSFGSRTPFLAGEPSAGRRRRGSGSRGGFEGACYTQPILPIAIGAGEQGLGLS